MTLRRLPDSPSATASPVPASPGSAIRVMWCLWFSFICSAGEDRLQHGLIQHSSLPGNEAMFLVISCCVPEGANNCYISSYLIVFDSSTNVLYIMDQDSNGDEFEAATLVGSSLMLYSREHLNTDGRCCPSLCLNREVTWDNSKHTLVVLQASKSISLNTQVFPACP